MTDESGFLDHIEELRKCILKSLSAVALFAVPCGIFWRRIVDIVMIYPLRYSDPRPELIITDPAEAVMLCLKISFSGGVILGIPVIMYQVWKFISPGLYKHEKRSILPGVISSSVLFLLGAGFSYLVIPYILDFLSSFSGGRMIPRFKVNEYLGFILRLVISFGIVFQLPVISFFLTAAGIITPSFIIKNFKYGLVVIFVISAFLTPPDVISQLFMSLPLILLYLISILISYTAFRKKGVEEDA